MRALVDGTVTAADIFSTSPAIPQNNLVVLEDPKNNFLAANVVPLVASQKMSDQLKTVLDAVSAKLTTEALIEMNTATSGNGGIDPDEAARKWVQDNGFDKPVSGRREDSMITFDAVTKKYPDGTVAVDDLTLDVPDGTLAVFVGPSGCGKTTSMRMINRMIDPTSGTLTVDGKDVTKVDAVKLRLGIGYVIQSAGLMPHLRVVDNVATVPVLKGESRRSARKAALGVLERVGLDPKLADRYPAQLSGGQQQRVGVARALAADPPILLMDEPFSAVDPVVREELQVEILRLQSELRKTIVFVTHDIDEALKLGEKVAVFGRGGVLQQYDAPRRLLSNPANDFVAGLHRRRPRLPRSAVHQGDRACRCTTSGRSRESGVDALDLGPDEWALVTKRRRLAVRVDRRQRRRPAPAGKVVVRQHHCRRLAVPARRHDAPGARRRAVVARRAGRRGRRATSR